ncbi:conserved hypothetical protein [Ixodes scapularis]|uniref:Cadherin domain-containing protein n=1 Tax=Ixodes scapularis TaxID=6945 RepID=B7Q6G4_IXOSC|nr:conserved hypothetical protein [Ixodes scapularis]|eukprot:XP_002402998.1 conserved hypothetical protein [Ixodes scapularis]
MTNEYDGTNTFPRFSLGGISEIVVRIKEGPGSLGQPLYRLRGEDADGDVLSFGAQGPEGPELLRFDRVSATEADVFLRHELDREVKDSHTVVLTLTDGRLPEGQYITQTMLVIVDDVNDNEPVFKQYRTTVTVSEDAAPQVIDTVEAIDRDQGPFGQVIYQLQDRANSGPRHTATAVVLVKVDDVEDQPPVFTQVPPVTRISEDLPLNSMVLTVKAMDGDRGVNNPISYSILSGGDGLFAIDRETGVVSVKGRLDREATENRNGAFILLVQAQEVSGSARPLGPTARTEVTILLTDVNDEEPTFRSRHYVAEVNENAQLNVPVNFVGDSIAEVYDHDQGSNGTFQLRLEKDNGVFEVTPSIGVNEVSFMIRVKNPDHLDYERVKLVKFKIVAQEMVASQPKTSTADVTVHIKDANDNFPVFREDSYRSVIPENAAAGTVVAVVRVSALFRLNGWCGVSRLKLDPETGKVVMATSEHGLDRETTPEYLLTVEARDENGRGNRNTVQLHLVLEDVNDNAPGFVLPSYEARIRENAADFRTPFVVRAVDADQAGTENCQVRYQIVRGDPDNNFTIDEAKGRIKPRQPLDFERIAQPRGDVRTFNLVVRAYDLGRPSLSSNVSVVVYVQDVNDHSPVFPSDFVAKSIPEDVQEGTAIVKVLAEDQDHSPSNSKVVYRIQNGAQDKFVIDALTGVISVAPGANLDPDRTFPKSVLYSLQILALDGGLGEQQRSSMVTVNISIVDVNNKAPRFDDPGTVELVENSVPGHTVAIVRATDQDDRPMLRYSLCRASSEARNEDGALVSEFDVQQTFEIHALEGKLMVKNNVDREKMESIKVCVRVEDMAAATPHQTATATLSVKVMDVNDNKPTFKKSFYRQTVTENSVVGAPIVTARAVDADKNHTVTYSLEGKAEYLALINIDRRTAWDNYEAGFGTDESRRTFKQVSVRVVDVNDESPVFVRQTQCAQVSEFHRAHETVFLASATDGDDPTSPNSKITFTLQSGFDADLFEVETLPDNTARVANRYSLRGRVGNATVALKAQDQGLPPRSSVQRFTVCVSDVNDHSPVFIRPPQNHTIRIPENATLGTVVVEVGAEDGDFGANAEVRYRLKDLPNNHWKTFRLDEITGIITLRLPLDRETQKVYELRVEAFDLGQPTSLSSDLDLTVFVTDVNDYAPEFTEDVVSLTFTENMKPGAESYKLINTIDRDDDLSILKPIPCYYIVGGNERGRFSLDLFTHQLSASEVLDREEESNYTLLVRASDDCFHEPRPVARFDSRDNTLLQVQITVLDVNDNPPRFVSPVFTGGVTMEADFGVVFMAVRAVDLDDGINSLVSYYLVGEIRRTLSEGLESLTGPPFLINHRTGELSLNFYPQRGMKGYFDLTVVANDTQGLQDSARVFVSTVPVDPPRLRDSCPRLVFPTTLSPTGSIRTRTAHMLIDKNIEFLDKLFKEFNVLYSEPADALSDAEREEDQMRTWLIGLSVFLSVMLALVISLCLAQRSRYERQLKAATATAFGSRDSALNRVDVPNTNQHSVEGSNPIWMHSYDNDWYKEDEETRNAQSKRGSPRRQLRKSTVYVSHTPITAPVALTSNRPVDSNSLDENAVAETSGSTSSSSDSHRQSQDREFDSAQLCSEVYVLSNGTVQNISMPVGSTDLLCPEVAERNNLNRYNKNGCPYASVFLGKMGTPNRAGKLEVSEL